MRFHGSRKLGRKSSASRGRTTRFVPSCSQLEYRQLLSIGQSGAAAGADEATLIPQPAATSRVVVSNESYIPNGLGASGGVNASQVGYLLNELGYSSTPVPLSAGTIATTAIVSTNPAVNEMGVTLTLTDLSITVLNPEMTSSTDAITDSQVNSDAYLVPSSTDLLDDHLGESTNSAILRASVASAAVNGAPESRSASTLVGRAVSSFGQSTSQVPSLSALSSQSAEFGEPPERAGNAKVSHAQSGPQSDQPPPSATSPQPAAADGQVPPAAPAARPATEGGQAPAPTEPPSAPGDQAPASSTAQTAPLPPIITQAVDAALELSDVRLLRRSRPRGSEESDDPTGAVILAFSSLSISLSCVSCRPLRSLGPFGYVRARWVPCRPCYPCRPLPRRPSSRPARQGR
jgi:hypothetical protein